MPPQVYHIHGSDAKWVTQQRETLLKQLIPSEMRDENLLELFSTSNQPLKLNEILPEVLSELSTIPFLPDSRRVVVVHNLADFLAGGSSGGRKKKAASEKKATRRMTPDEELAYFVEHDLPATTNVLVFSTLLEVERGQRMDTDSALYKIIAPPVGQVIKPAHREDDPIFLMSDALCRRNAVGCLKQFRIIYRDDARGRIFHEILRNVRFLLQAKILERVEGKGSAKDVIEMKYLPNDKRLNLYQQHPFVQKKIRENASRFQLRELMLALDQLLKINTALIPSQQDVYAPDVQLMLETFIVSFCEGTGPKR
jgi:hypothetical protein